MIRHLTLRKGNFPMASSPPSVVLRLIEQLEQASTLAALSKRIQALLDTALPDGRPRDLLEGRPIGHALHPVLSDVPIGSWTSSVILDLLGGESAESSADLLIVVGLTAALPTAISGWTDWSRTDKRQQRVGLVHAAVNISAVSLFAFSLRERRRDRRNIGKLLSLAGAGSMGTAAYLGGHLSFARGVGVGERS
jgi:uncharacterized membrane protein